MSKIYEMLGYPLESKHEGVLESRRSATCPFLEAECDGGGNRYSSALQLDDNHELLEYFRDKETVQAGVCSLMVSDKPWIVCPRRLLTLHGFPLSSLQATVRERVVGYGELSAKETYRTWSEVKISVPMRDKTGQERLFNYTFDYVIAGQRSLSMTRVSNLMEMSESKCCRIAEENGMTMTRRNGETWIDDVPSAPLVIVEVMTSSTSGGDKKKRTQIGMAFEDALLRSENHKGPGINYRQIWARMASQLIVKSQVAIKWNAKTIWVLQDVLADYISATTGLDLEAYVADQANEVNVLAVGYEGIRADRSGVLPLAVRRFYSGPVSLPASETGRGGFVDIIKAGAIPPVRHLWKALFRKSPCGAVGPVAGDTPRSHFAEAR